MANLTITVDDEVLKLARRRALDQRTSVNALLREYLESYSGWREDRNQAVRRFLSRAQQSRASRGDHQWSREDLHERP